MATLPPLPSGFQVEAAPAGAPVAPVAAPPLPPGFQIEGPGGASPPVPASPPNYLDQFKADFARNSPPPGPEDAQRVQGNPQASAIPQSVLGQAQALNTLNAATSGVQDTVLAHLSDEIGAGLMTPIEMAVNRTWDVPKSFQDVLASNQAARQDRRALNPAAYETGSGLGTIASVGVAPNAQPGAVAPSTWGMVKRGAALGGSYGALNGFGSSNGDLQDRLSNAAVQGATGALTGVGAGMIAGMATPKATNPALAPSIDDLQAQAGALYDKARASGVVAPQSQTISLSDNMFQIAKDEGLVSPTGRIDSSYPRIRNVLRTIDDYSHGEMSVPQMQATRRTLQGAAGSNDSGERRLGKIMLDEFDNFTSKLSPDLGDAAAVYHRAKKGELIDTAIELAHSRAGQYSGSGFENALRTEFRGLDRQIIKGQLKGITPEEAAAISKVANGGPIENAARWVGKFAPTGVVSASLSGGVPFAIGNAMGGPAVGATLAAGSMGAGLAGRALAARMATGNAEIASALMRRGGPATPLASPLTAVQRAMLGGLVTFAGPEYSQLPMDVVGSALLRSRE